MLKKTFAICALTVCTFMGLQAIDQEKPSILIPIENSDNQNQQEDLSNTEKKSKILSCKKENDKNQSEKIACKEKEKNKVLTPGALVCNGSEDKCIKEGDQEESPSSSLFSVFCGDHEDEEKLLACKNCQ